MIPMDISRDTPNPPVYTARGSSSASYERGTFFLRGERRDSYSLTLSASTVMSRIILNPWGINSESSLVPYVLESSSGISCSICLDTLDEEDAEFYEVPVCNHIFHKRCISTWKKESSKCPCCRGPLPIEIGPTLSVLENIPAADELPEITRANVLENVIFSPVGIIFPFCLVCLFILLEVAIFVIFIVLTFAMAMYVIFQEEAQHIYSTICLGIIVCSLFPLVIVFLVVCFILQICYIVYRTGRFYCNIFSCRIRWRGCTTFIIERTIVLTTYVFELLDAL
jgi:hypothetical protein